MGAQRILGRLLATAMVVLGGCTLDTGVPERSGGAGSDAVAVGVYALGPAPDTSCVAAQHQAGDYWFCSNLRSWQTARDKCTAVGLNLVTIDDELEKTFVKSRIGADSWIGGTDSTVENEWRWAESNVQFWQGGPACASDASLGPTGLCYHTSSTLRTWSSALSYCQARGSGWSLAKVATAEVNTFLHGLFSGSTTSRWLGANDIPAEGVWKWTDGTQFWQGGSGGSPTPPGSYANWDAGEPNDGPAPGDCARMLYTNGKFGDTSCSNNFGTACEGPSVGTPTNGLYSNWSASEPNNADGAAQADCGRILLADGTWRDSNCATGRRYVCEDFTDNCPLDPDKKGPGVCGCGIPDDDADGDGTSDCNDACPLDPARTVPDCAPDTGCTRVVAGGSAYWACGTTRDYETARTKCIQAGYQLARIDSAAENAFLTQFVPDDWWIGGNDLVQEGVWRWEIGGDQFWQGTAACPSDASLGPDGRCWHASTTSCTRATARANCQNRGPGWDLAKITSAAVNSFAHALCSSPPSRWIGANDILTEGTFIWTDGTPLAGNYTNWDIAGGEPNGSGDGVRLYYTTGEWADTDTTLGYGYLCDGPTSGGGPVGGAYTNWDSGEPDDLGGMQECLQLLDDGKWNDDYCTETEEYFCEDMCPADTAKSLPGVCGCGVSDADFDADGTPDCNDGCPHDPARTAPPGCEDLGIDDGPVVQGQVVERAFECEQTGGVQPGAPWPSSAGTCPQRRGVVEPIGPQSGEQVHAPTDLGVQVASSPVVDKDGNTYVGAVNGCIYKIDSSGASTSLFCITPCTGDCAIASTPVITATNRLVFGSNDSSVRAVTLTGAPVWSFATSGPVKSSPLVASDGTIYIGSSDGQLYARNSDGTEKWTTNQGCIGTDCGIESSPTLDPTGTVVFFGDNGGSLRALFTSDGSLKWDHDLLGAIKASPVFGRAADKRLYVAVSGKDIIGVGLIPGKLSAIDSDDGSVDWTFLITCTTEENCAMESTPALSPDLQTIYFTGGSNSRFYAVHESGFELWSDPIVGSVRGSPLTAGDGTIYLPQGDGIIAWRPCFIIDPTPDICQPVRLFDIPIVGGCQASPAFSGLLLATKVLSLTIGCGTKIFLFGEKYRRMRGPDFNDNGFEDLVIGVPGGSCDGVGSTVPGGEIMALRGDNSAVGYNVVDLGINDFLCQDIPQVDDDSEVDPDTGFGDAFGNQVAWGDFDGDGRDDLVVGVPMEDFEALGVEGAGMIHVFPGSSDETLLFNRLGADVFFRGDGIPGSPIRREGLGELLKAGDFNGDGVDDLVVSNRGFHKVVVLEGHPVTGLAFDIEFDTGGNLRDAPTGDFNCDGYEDVALLMAGPDPAMTLGAVQPGLTIRTHRGSGNGLSPSPVVQVVDAAGEFKLQSDLGAVAGNFDGDVADLTATRPCIDLAIGVGAVGLLGLSGHRFGPFTWAGFAAVDPEQRGEGFGRSLDVTNVNSDFYDDLIVGMGRYDYPELGVFEAGAFRIFVGGSNLGGDIVFSGNRLFRRNDKLYGAPTTLVGGGHLPVSGSSRGQFAVGFPGEIIGTLFNAGSVQIGRYRWDAMSLARVAPRVEDNACADCGPATAQATFGWTFTRTRPAFRRAGP